MIIAWHVMCRRGYLEIHGIGYGVAGCQMKAGSLKKETCLVSFALGGVTLQSTTMLATRASSKYCKLVNLRVGYFETSHALFSRDCGSLHFNSHIYWFRSFGTVKIYRRLLRLPM